MSPALYLRFRPALRAFLHRHPRRDLQAELGAAIEERNEARRSRDWWSKEALDALMERNCQSQNIAEGMRQVEALRAALVRLLWRAVNDHSVCVCEEAGGTSALCEAWRALGFEGQHFEWENAKDLLPVVRP